MNRGARCVERQRRLGERDEHQPFDRPEMDRLQPVLRLVEIRRHVPRRAQRAVEIVGSRRDRGRPARWHGPTRCADARSAMAADIGEGAQRAVPAAHDDDAFLAPSHGETSRRAPARMEACPAQNPMAEEDALHVVLERFGDVVERLLERMRGRLPRARSRRWRRRRFLRSRWRRHVMRSLAADVSSRAYPRCSSGSYIGARLARAGTAPSGDLDLESRRPRRARRSRVSSSRDIAERDGAAERDGHRRPKSCGRRCGRRARSAHRDRAAVRDRARRNCTSRRPAAAVAPAQQRLAADEVAPCRA